MRHIFQILKGCLNDDECYTPAICMVKAWNKRLHLRFQIYLERTLALALCSCQFGREINFMYRGISGAVRVTEFQRHLLDVWGGRVTRKSNSFSPEYSTNPQLSTHYMPGKIPTSLLNHGVTRLLILHIINEQMWKPKRNYKRFSSALHCDVGACSLVIWQVNWKITPGWPVLENVLICISSRKRHLQTICFCVAVLGLLLQPERIRSFSDISAVRNCFTCVGLLGFFDARH